MHNAMKIGYHACAVEILRGYYFNRKEVIFKEYIQELYNLRLQYDKSHPMNFIAKILMNSLYGRFGMDDSFNNVSIINNKEFNNFISKASDKKLKLITDIDNIGDNNKIISIEKDATDTMLDNGSETHNVNIAVASSITALARIEMSKFKNNSNIKLYYTDTDSIFVNLSPQELDSIFPNICGNEIGKMKIEYIANRAVFLGPKAYFIEIDQLKQKNIIKIKGLNNALVNNSELTLDKFHQLLCARAISITIIKESFYTALAKDK